MNCVSYYSTVPMCEINDMVPVCYDCNVEITYNLNSNNNNINIESMQKSMFY